MIAFFWTNIESLCLLVPGSLGPVPPPPFGDAEAAARAAAAGPSAPGAGSAAANAAFCASDVFAELGLAAFPSPGPAALALASRVFLLRIIESLLVAFANVRLSGSGGPDFFRDMKPPIVLQKGGLSKDLACGLRPPLPPRLVPSRRLGLRNQKRYAGAPGTTGRKRTGKEREELPVIRNRNPRGRRPP